MFNSYLSDGKKNFGGNSSLRGGTLWMHGQVGQCALFQHGQIRVTHLGHQPVQSAHGLVAILAALVKVKADAREGRDGAIEDANDLRKRRVFGVFQKVVSAALALLGAQDACLLYTSDAADDP